MFSDSSDVFLTVYLLEQPFIKDPTLPTRTESFAETYAREKQRRGNSDDEAD